MTVLHARAASVRCGMGRRAPAASAAALALLPLLAACATSPPSAPAATYQVESSRVYEGANREAVFERTLAAIEAAGLRVAEADRTRGVIAAELAGFQDRGWAECPRRFVYPRDDTDRARLATPLERSLQLTASVSGAPAGAAVNLDTTVVERQRNSFTNLTFSERCRSTGALERQILQAV